MKLTLSICCCFFFRLFLSLFDKRYTQLWQLVKMFNKLICIENRKRESNVVSAPLFTHVWVEYKQMSNSATIPKPTVRLSSHSKQMSVYFLTYGNCCLSLKPISRKSTKSNIPSCIHQCYLKRKWAVRSLC